MITNEERFTRLRMLHDMLLDFDTHFPNVKFDIGAWIERNEGDDAETKPQCACVAGAVALYPPFQKMGMSVYSVAYPVSLPEYEDNTGSYAIEKFFGIDRDDSKSIAYPPEMRNNAPDITPAFMAGKVALLITKYEEQS